MEKLKQFTMGLIKLRSSLIISILFLSFYSCKENNLKNTKGTQLECLIDIFLEKKSQFNEEYVYISENQNWTDSTSVISFQYSSREPSQKQISNNPKTANYKKHKLIYFVNSFSTVFQKDRLIKSSLDWRNVVKKDEKSFNGNKELNSSEYEIQFIYNFKTKKIENVLKAYPVNESIILKKAIQCN